MEESKNRKEFNRWIDEQFDIAPQYEILEAMFMAYLEGKLDGLKDVYNE